MSKLPGCECFDEKSLFGGGNLYWGQVLTTNISSRVQMPQAELNWPTRGPQDWDVNWNLLLTQIQLYTLILSVTWQYERSLSNWEWHVYRRRWVIRQIRTRKGLRGRYRPVKPIWRWQGQITAKLQDISRKGTFDISHYSAFPQWAYFLQPRLSTCSHGGYWFSYHAAKPPTAASEIGDIFKQGTNGLETGMKIIMKIEIMLIFLLSADPFNAYEFDVKWVLKT